MIYNRVGKPVFIHINFGEQVLKQKRHPSHNDKIRLHIVEHLLKFMLANCAKKRKLVLTDKIYTIYKKKADSRKSHSVITLISPGLYTLNHALSL